MVFVIITLLIGINGLNVAGEKAAINSGPILKVDIPQILGWFALDFHVENIGDETAHNVILYSTSFEGQVVYNNRTKTITEELEPGEKTRDGTSIFFGFGMFTVTIIVTCDEGVSDTVSANGLAIGPFCFIP